jgi:hypothetical protein
MRDASTFAGRYNLAVSPDWQALLTLFELNDGFAFIVLLVPNEEGAIVCGDALAKLRGASGKELLELKTTLAHLVGIADALLLTEARPETGAVWVPRVVSEGRRIVANGGTHGAAASPRSISTAIRFAASGAFPWLLWELRGYRRSCGRTPRICGRCGRRWLG